MKFERQFLSYKCIKRDEIMTELKGQIHLQENSDSRIRPHNKIKNKNMMVVFFLIISINCNTNESQSNVHVSS